MENLNYFKQAMDLINFMAGTEEDSNVDPQDIEILAQEIEATNSTGYDDYDDDHRVEQPADGINIMKLIETSIARYTANIKEYSSGMNPGVMAKDVINNSKNEWYDRATAIIMTTFAKNKNDVEQTLDTEVLKEYNKLTMLIKNKSKMKKLLGTNNDPFLLEGIVVTYDIFTRMLLAYVPVKVQTGETLASIINKRSGVVFMKLLDAVKYINSIQSKLGTKIYYKEPLVSEITGKKIDTIKDTKFDFRRNDQDREDSGFRDYNREVIVTAGRESAYETIGGFFETGLEGTTADYYNEGTEGLFSWIKDKVKGNKSVNIISEKEEKDLIKWLVNSEKELFKLAKDKLSATEIKESGFSYDNNEDYANFPHWYKNKKVDHFYVNHIVYDQGNQHDDKIVQALKSSLNELKNKENGKYILNGYDESSYYVLQIINKENKFEAFIINNDVEEGTEGVLDSVKHYLWDTPKEAVLNTYSGIKFTKEDYEFLNKTLPSIMRDYVRQVNKSPLLKENGVKAELPDTMPIDVYKGWVSQPKLNRTMWIPIAKFTGLTSFKLKFKSLTAGGSWKMALERIPDRWKSKGSKLQEVSGGHLLLIESPGFRTKEVSVESYDYNPEMFYDSEDFIKNYHLSCESIENLIEIRNNNSLLEYSKLIKALAFTTTLFKPLSGYDVENMCKDIDRLFKDTSANVVSLITGLIAKMDVKIIAPINITYKRYSETSEGKSMTEQQFMPKEFDKSMEGRMYDSARPKVEEYEDF